MSIQFTFPPKHNVLYCTFVVVERRKTTKKKEIFVSFVLLTSKADYLNLLKLVKFYVQVARKVLFVS